MSFNISTPPPSVPPASSPGSPANPSATPPPIPALLLDTEFSLHFTRLGQHQVHQLISWPLDILSAVKHLYRLSPSENALLPIYFSVRDLRDIFRGLASDVVTLQEALAQLLVEFEKLFNAWDSRGGNDFEECVPMTLYTSFPRLIFAQCMKILNIRLWAFTISSLIKNMIA